MPRNTSPVYRYKSRGLKISSSGQHAGLWIIDLPDGTFYTIESSYERMVTIHPPDERVETK